MSHLQPNFIAKNKARIQNARAPKRMPRSMIKKEAERAVVQDWLELGERSWYCWCGVTDHRIFTLRK